MKVETVEVNGVIVNKGDEESAAKWAKKEAKSEAKVEVSEEVEEADGAPKKGRPKKEDK